MPEWLTGLPEWLWTMIALVGAFLTLLARKRRRAKIAADSGLPPAVRGPSCQSCLHWSLEEGQRAMRQNPAFSQAAGVLSPNAMMASQTDSDGEGNGKRRPLPTLEDNWQYIGACLGYEEMRHRTDKCPHFRAADLAMLRGARPGDGFPAHAREELRATTRNPDLDGNVDG